MNTTAPKDISEIQQAQGSANLRRVINNNQRPFVIKSKPSQKDRDLPEIIDVMDFLGASLAKPPELIYKVLGERDENSNGDIATMMNELDRIVEETGAAVVFGHHFSKGNQAKKDAMDRMSGAGAFARDADSLLVLTKHEQPDTFTVETILRNHKPVDSFCVTVEHPIMVRNDALDPTKVKKINGTEKKYTVGQLMKVLNIQQLSRADLERQFKHETRASEGTFDKLFKEAQSKDIEKCDEGRKWKAVNPVFPPGYNACTHQTNESGATVQNSAIAPSAPC